MVGILPPESRVPLPCGDTRERLGPRVAADRTWGTFLALSSSIHSDPTRCGTVQLLQVYLVGPNREAEGSTCTSRSRRCWQWPVRQLVSAVPDGLITIHAVRRRSGVPARNHRHPQRHHASLFKVGPPPLSASNSRRVSSSEMSADQPYTAATAAFKGAVYIGEPLRSRLVQVRQYRFVSVRFLSALAESSSRGTGRFG